MFDADIPFETACPILARQRHFAYMALGELLACKLPAQSEILQAASGAHALLAREPSPVIDRRLLAALQESVVTFAHRGNVQAALAAGRCLYVLTRRPGHGWLFFLNLLIDARIFPDPHMGVMPSGGINAAVPRAIIQYWDQPEPPGDVAAMIASWRGVPGFTHRLFDHAQAGDYLAQHCGPRIAAAYDAARHVAGQADIFRLAWLYQQGGVYVDADERLVGNIHSVMPPDCRLLLTWAQGIPPCIQNGFIVAAPAHPLIASALMLAVTRVEHESRTAIRQSAWIQTGPGVVSMAVLDDFAVHGKPVAAAGLHLMRDPVHRTVVQSDEFLEYRQHAQGNWRL